MPPPFDPDRLDARDPAFVRSLLPTCRWLNAHYLRLRTSGLEHIPRTSAVFVSNHNGGIAGPDLVATIGTLWDVLGPDAPLYALAHDFVMRQAAPVGRALARVGALRASPSNVPRVIAAGGQILVYPGGDLEAYRHARLRDRIVLGERTGFVRCAQAAGVPIVPIVVHGAHRSAYIFHEGERLAQLLPRRARLRRFPLAFALPWGLAVGPYVPYFPLPFRLTLRVLSPVEAAPHDEPARVREIVQERMQAALDEMSQQARSAAR